MFLVILLILFLGSTMGIIKVSKNWLKDLEDMVIKLEAKDNMVA